MAIPPDFWILLRHSNAIPQVHERLFEAVRPPHFAQANADFERRRLIEQRHMALPQVYSAKLGFKEGVSYIVRPGRMRVHRDQQVTEVRLDALPGGDWLLIKFNTGHVGSRAEWVQELLDHLRPLYPLLTPSFGFADLHTSIARHVELGADRIAWPWMLLGPDLVAKHGLDHLRKAPAWRVEELAYGGVLIEVAENPFTATRRQVKALADHLGLEAPR